MKSHTSSVASFDEDDSSLPQVFRAVIEDDPDGIEAFEVNLTNSCKQTPLFVAAKENKKQALSRLLQLNCDVDKQDFRGHAPLHAACLLGHTDICRLLLEAGASVLLEDQPGNNTPLHLAASKNKPVIVEMLLEKGANVDSRNLSNNTPLHISTFLNLPENINLLIAHGCKLNLKNQLGYTPLHLACMLDSPEAALRLIDATADTRVEDMVGNTALHFAISRGLQEVVEALSDDGSTIDASNDEGITPLFLAVQHNNLPVVKRLLAAGASVKSKINKGGISLLDMASYHGHYEICKLLLNKGADLQYSLHWAAFRGHKTIVQMLVNNGASCELANRQGYSPCYLAMARGHLDCLKILMSSPDEVLEVVGSGGVELACYNGHLTLVRWLVEGATLDLLLNLNWLNLLVLATKGNHPAILQTLLKTHPNLSHLQHSIQMTLLQALKWDCLESAKVLVAFVDKFESAILKKVCANQPQVIIAALSQCQDDAGNTPLHYAAYMKDEELAWSLLKNKADPNVCNGKGNIPLHIAAEKGSIALASRLLDKGSDLEAKNLQGQTPLHLACASGSCNIFHLLEKYRANLAVLDSSGSSILHYAATTDQEYLLKHILKKYPKLSKIQNQVGKLPLQVAVDYGNSAAIDILVSVYKTSQNNLPTEIVFSALCHNNIKPTTLAALLPLVDLSKTFQHKLSLLHVAVLKGNLEAVQQLLLQQPDMVTLTCDHGWTPIHLAVMAKQNEILGFLLNQPCTNANGIDSKGQTPLQIALEQRLWPQLECLAENGGRLLVEDPYFFPTYLSSPTSGNFGLTKCPRILAVWNHLRRQKTVQTIPTIELAVICFLCLDNIDIPHTIDPCTLSLITFFLRSWKAKTQPLESGSSSRFHVSSSSLREASNRAPRTFYPQRTPVAERLRKK